MVFLHFISRAVNFNGLPNFTATSSTRFPVKSLQEENTINYCMFSLCFVQTHFVALKHHNYLTEKCLSQTWKPLLYSTQAVLQIFASEEPNNVGYKSSVRRMMAIWYSHSIFKIWPNCRDFTDHDAYLQEAEEHDNMFFWQEAISVRWWLVSVTLQNTERRQHLNIRVKQLNKRKTVIQYRYIPVRSLLLTTRTSPCKK